MESLSRIFAALAVASTVAFFAGRTEAAVFAAWEVTDVAWGDVLNVRKYPSGSSQKQGAYPNGTVLQMTGRCTGGAPNLLDITHLPDAQERQIVRYVWCEIWHDPAQNGNFKTGWVYGKYIKPH